MENLTNLVKKELHRYGAEIVGFGDLRELPPEVRENLPIGICVAVKFKKEIICGIAELPTREYADAFEKLNEKLDEIVTRGVEFLKALGFNASAKTKAVYIKELTTALPHKTVATRAGIGWIGKSALLVTEEFGSMIRISSILTDAPLETAAPVNESKCGACEVCKNACPANAISGKSWSVDVYRDEFFDAEKCRDTARERSRLGFGGKYSICGKCIEICPYTKKFNE
jgi:epoxyqueuosine reductase QueG